MSATVSKPGEKPRTVKNLGWLLRNWQGVRSFQLDLTPDSRDDLRLVAHLRDGGRYETDFASLTVCWRWLSRPVFQSVAATVTAPGGACRAFTIHSPEWVAQMKAFDAVRTGPEYRAAMDTFLATLDEKP